MVDIGLDSSARPGAERWLAGWTVEDWPCGWPYPDARSDKYSRGVVGIDTGSDHYPGAGGHDRLGAVYAGAGMVRFLGADRPAELIASSCPTWSSRPGRVQAHLFGSGWGERADGAGGARRTRWTPGCRPWWTPTG